MKKANPVLKYSLTVICPYCGDIVDLADEKYEGEFTNMAFVSHGEMIEGEGIECNECGKDIQFGEMEIL